MNTSESIRRTNRAALIVCAAACLAILLLQCLPLYDFSATVYTKKSGNTFVGDEKYVAVRAEVEAAAQARADETGSMPEIVENVTERVNSKGEKTSMVAWEVRETMKKTGWDFMRSGLTSGTILLASVLCACAALLLCVLGLRGKTFDLDWASVTGGPKVLRRLACWLALIALLLIPVFLMQNNLAFSRQIRLATDGFPKPGLEALLTRLDAFLYGGTAGENTLSLMSGISYRALWPVWAMMLLLAAQLMACVVASEGRPGRTLQRGALYAFIILQIGRAHV